MPLHQLMLLQRRKQKQDVPRAVILLLFLIRVMEGAIQVLDEVPCMRKI